MRARDPLLEPAGVGVQRAAAALRSRHVDVEASACSTRAVAALTSPKTTLCTQPASERHPRPVVRQVLRGGHSGAAHGGAIRFRGASGPGAGSLRKSERRAQTSAVREHGEDPGAHEPVERPRLWLRSTWSRVCSISRSYCTPDGHELTQAMQPRQRSKCSTTVSVSAIVPSTSPASGRSARAASPSPRARASRSGRSAGRSRSGRSRRSARAAHRLHARARRAGSRRGSSSLLDVGDARARAARAAPPRRPSAARPAGAPAARAARPRVRLLAAERLQLRVDRPRRALEEDVHAAVDDVHGARRELRVVQLRASPRVDATTVRAAAGSGCRRSASRSTAPSRPREPQKSLPRS